MSEQAMKSYDDLAPSATDKFRQRVLPFIVMIVLLVAIPLFDPSRTMNSLIAAMGINIVFALSYNMLLGRAGLLSFGHAVYFGLGGYAVLHAMNAIGAGSSGFWAGFPVFMLPVIGFAAGALAGVVIGWPSCKRSGVPFAMISLGVAELVASAGYMFGSIFGGEMGVTSDRMVGPRLFGLSMGPVEDIYWFVAFWTFLGTLGIYAFTRTPLGKMSEATRDNPERVQFVGYNPDRVRYLVFIFAGAFAGLAGGMSAVNYEIFTPESLSLAPSGLVLLMAYIGGIRYFTGPIMGAVLLTYMQSMLSDYSEAWLLYLGLLFIAIVMYAPGGVAGIVYGLLGIQRRGGTDGVLARRAKQAAGVALAFTGLVILVEIAVRWSNGYGEVFEPFGLHLGIDTPLSWFLIAGFFAAGFGVLRMARDIEEGHG
jgi:branched-chain amino acid transport system permease protein